MRKNQRLAWACRRGMLELDVLLGNFLREAYPSLSCDAQEEFANLLNFSDPELADWLVSGISPEDPAIIPLVEKIRTHARSRI